MKHVFEDFNLKRERERRWTELRRMAVKTLLWCGIGVVALFVDTAIT